MTRRIVTVISTVALALACSNGGPVSPTAPAAGTSRPADGSTLKASAPEPLSPIGNQKLETTDPPTLTASQSSATYDKSVAPQYRFVVFNEAGTEVDSALVSSPSWQVTKELEFEKRHTWQVRAEYQGEVGAWSSTNASFVTAEGAFLRGSQVRDPLTNGRTVGRQKGGHFIAGRGWQSDTVNDGIDYDITTCASCTMEFDITNIGKGEGVCCMADLKFMSMGDASSFGDFSSFRNNPWKMHLIQRADGDGTGLEIIWRNGGTDPDGNPGDHRIKMTCCGPDFRNSSVFHFVVQWTPRGYNISVGTNGGPQVPYLADGFGEYPYAPPNHRVSLGCYPRSETFANAIWSNVKVTPG